MINEVAAAARAEEEDEPEVLDQGRSREAASLEVTKMAERKDENDED